MVIQKEKVYVIQFGMGGTINLIPFGAGMLISSLKRDNEIIDRYEIEEIIFQRENPKQLVERMEKCSIIAFCCAAWNLNLSLKTAREVRKKFPSALILFGGSAIPATFTLAKEFLQKYPEVDLIGKGEGEELIVEICNEYIPGKSLRNIKGIICKDHDTREIYETTNREVMTLELLPSPYLDGTFDGLLHKDNFSGVIMEFTRGCPFQCTFCGWGFPEDKRLRKKPLWLIRKEIEWVGKNDIKYISLADSNFGMDERDLEIAEMLTESKKRFNAPDYISLNWVKNSSPRVIEVANILKQAGISFRVTLSLESTNQETLKAIKRFNLFGDSLEKIRNGYRLAGLYCYTELLLGLPLETYNSFMDGIEKSLGKTILEQIFIYLLYLIPNTELASTFDKEKYGLHTQTVIAKYPKNKELEETEEHSEIVISTSTMSTEEWGNSFVESFFTLALHDECLTFFIFTYLKKEHNIRIVDLIHFIRNDCQQRGLKIIKKSFEKLEKQARVIQTSGESQFIKAEGYGEVLWDPSQAIFLELLSNRKHFYPEFMTLVEAYLTLQKKEYNPGQFAELFAFNEAVIAHPLGPKTPTINLQYDWISYFRASFGHTKTEKTPLHLQPREISIVDPKPSLGDYDTFIKNNFNIRGIHAFNDLFDKEGNKVFPI